MASVSSDTGALLILWLVICSPSDFSNICQPISCVSNRFSRHNIAIVLMSGFFQYLAKFFLSAGFSLFLSAL